MENEIKKIPGREGNAPRVATLTDARLFFIFLFNCNSESETWKQVALPVLMMLCVFKCFYF